MFKQVYTPDPDRKIGQAIVKKVAGDGSVSYEPVVVPSFITAQEYARMQKRQGYLPLRKQLADQIKILSAMNTGESKRKSGLLSDVAQKMDAAWDTAIQKFTAAYQDALAKGAHDQMAEDGARAALHVHWAPALASARMNGEALLKAIARERALHNHGKDL